MKEGKKKEGDDRCCFLLLLLCFVRGCVVSEVKERLTR